MDNRVGLLIKMLKQPSTIKGLIGLLGIAGWKIAPEEYQTAIEGLGVLYMFIAIFWQKS